MTTAPLDDTANPSNPPTSTATATQPKSVKIDGEPYLKHFLAQDSSTLVGILTRGFPSEHLADLDLEIRVERGTVQVHLDCRKGQSTEVVFHFEVVKNGREVHIELAEIGYEIQQGGIVKKLMHTLLELIEDEPKVEKISLQANIDVGGYAWARYGFEPNDPKQIVEDLQDSIGEILQNGSFTYEDVTRKVDLTPAIEAQLKKLQSLSKKKADARDTFQLLCNALTKVSVPGGAIQIPLRRFKGGAYVSQLIDKFEFLKSPDAIQEDRDDYEFSCKHFAQRMQDFATSLNEALQSKKVPSSAYVISPEGEKNILELLNLISKGSSDPLALARSLDAITIEAIAEPTEVSLSALFMLGSDWSGSVRRPTGGGQLRASENGWNRLKDYVGFGKKGSNQ